MADIQLRFNRDLLVISSPIEVGLSRLDIDAKDELVAMNILEPESVSAAYAPDLIASTPCIVANTRDILPARLSQINMEDKIEDLATAAIDILANKNIQHIFVELGSTGLPFDPTSKQSCIEIRDQYVCSGRIFEKLDKDRKHKFDAYLLSGITRVDDLKVALMGLRQVSDKPIFANVVLDSDGRINNCEDVYDVASVMSEFGAAVAGITANCDAETTVKLVKRMRAGCDLPIMVEFVVTDKNYYETRDLRLAVNECIKAGAQFFRVSGNAVPAHTAVLIGSTTYPEDV